MIVLDTNRNTTAKLQQLKDLGIKTIIRYLATGDKSVTPAEAHAIAARGFRLGLVYEAWGDTKGELYGGLGSAHARDALAKAPRVGAPDGAAIYFAVDNDESASDIRNRIIPYFQALKLTINGRYRVGVYGSGAVCAAVLDAGLAELTWISCSTGWAGYSAFKASGRWNLLQHVPALAAGLDTDPDEINPLHPDIGDFVPFGALPAAAVPSPAAPDAVPAPAASVPAMPPVHDAKWLQTRLNELGASPPLKVDGDLGPKTIEEIAKHLPA